MKKVIFSIGICILLLTACGKKAYETIDTNKAIELIDSGAVIIDVRSNSEYESEHIPQAINIPLEELDTISYDFDTTLIIYCQTGIRSEKATKKLAEMGYTSLYNLDGGLINWGGQLEE